MSSLTIRPDVLGDEMNFINMVHFSAFLGPIASTTTLAAFLESTQGDKDYTSLLPDHLPEVGEGGWKWRLGGHVSWGTWIMIGLEEKFLVKRSRQPRDMKNSRKLTIVDAFM